MSLRRLKQHTTAIRRCTRCPEMAGTPVVGNTIESPVMLVGQAPGVREAEFDRPFAWTAGRTLFSWFARLGLSEDEIRKRVYFAAVCRCFPGKSKTGTGDRVPSPIEIERCRGWLDAELKLLKPRLVIPVGKLAIAQFLPADLLQKLKLDQIIGKTFECTHLRHQYDVIPLPHPSGASPWHRVEPGKRLLGQALRRIGKHEAFESIRSN